MKKLYLVFLLYFPELASAQQPTDSLLTALKKGRLDTHKVRLLYDVAYRYWLDSDDSLAIRYCLESLSLAKSLKFSSGESRARLQLARIELDRFTDVASAYAHLDTTLQTATRLKDKRTEGMVYFRRAQFYKEFLEKQSQVEPLLNKALKLFSEAGDKSLQGQVYNLRAQGMGENGKFAEAVELLLKARKLQEETQDMAALRSTVPNLGVMYSAMGLYTEALQTFDEAEEIARKRKDNVLSAFLNNQRAEIFEKQGEYHEALTELEKAVKIHYASQAPYWLARTYARLGHIYLKMNDYTNGLKYTEMADNLYKKDVDSNESMDHYVQHNLGKIHLAKKEYKKVIAYAKAGLEWATDAEPPLIRESAEYNRQLAVAYEALGQSSKALFHLRQHKSLSDTVLNNDAVQRIVASSMTYTFDKKRQGDKLMIEQLENEKLTQLRNFLLGLSVLGFSITGFVFWSNRKLSNKNAELTAKNKEIGLAVWKGQTIERKRVASELHDNLNTKLAALRWRLEAMNVTDYDEGDQKIHQGSVEMLEDIYEDVRLISHSMLPAELESQGLVFALGKLIDNLHVNSKTRFHLITNDFDQRRPAALEHQFYIIILELINNVLKHSHASDVWISIGRSERSIALVVSDNGIGMSGNSEGMGMKNLENRVAALGGTLAVESLTGNGTKTTIEIMETVA
jgi:signal transduction histidine kinase